MKKLVFLIVLLLSITLAFSGCAVITNIFDPLPDNYVDGVKVPKEYPDDYLEIYDDAIVFEAEEDDGEVVLKIGTMDEIDDVIDFFEDLFDDDDFIINETDDSKDEYFAEGIADKYSFEIFAEEAKGEYEERAFATVIEITTKELGKETLEDMQGFWHACGLDGVISDETRRMGMGLDIDDMKMDTYKAFELNKTNVDFRFIDDTTIMYTTEGEDFFPEITFETIDGVDVMTMDYEGEKIHLEKTNVGSMLEYAVVGEETLAKMQGFWLFCGSDGVISDEDRMMGYAMQFGNMLLDTYEDSWLYSMDLPFEFIDNDTIVYTEDGEEIILDVKFETIDGIDVMTLTNDGFDVHMEKSTIEDMWTYYDMGGEEGGYIYLSDYLDDDDLEWYISDADWTYAWYYSAGTGQYEQATVTEIFTFYSTYYGQYSDGNSWYETTWYIYDSMLYVTIYGETDIYLEFYIDFEYDGETIYLYLYNATDGFAGDAWVYTGLYY